MTSTALTIRGRAIRVDENGLTCLNDIWKAAGFTKNQRPNDWARLPTTIKRMEKVLALITGKSRNYNKADMHRVFRTRRGADGGTYADLRLALDYAEYLNPALAIEVKEVYLRYKAADPALADDIMERSDGAANEWMAKRSISRATRLAYTDTLKRHGVVKPGDYAECTNATYRGLFGKRAKDLRTERGIKGNTRDALDLKELATVSFAEVMASDRIEDEDCRGFGECHSATLKVASGVKDMIDRDMRDRQKRLM